MPETAYRVVGRFKAMTHIPFLLDRSTFYYIILLFFKSRNNETSPDGMILVSSIYWVIIYGTLIPSAQRLVWAAKQALGNAALGALFA